MVLMTIQKTPLIIGIVLGFVQFHLLGRSLVRVPIGAHRVLELPWLCVAKCFPDSFIPLESTQNNLEALYEGRPPLSKDSLPLRRTSSSSSVDSDTSKETASEGQDNEQKVNIELQMM